MVVWLSAVFIDRSGNPAPAAIVLIARFFSYPSLQAIAVGQIWVELFLVTCWTIAMITKRWFLGAALLGLLLATRQTALLLAGAAAVYMIGKVSWSKYSALAAVAVTLWIIPFLPFADGDILSLMKALYMELPSAQSARAWAVGNPGNQVSLSGWLTPAWIDSYGIWLQASIAITFSWMVLRNREGSPAAFVASSGGFYLLMIAFNPYVHRYYYLTGFLMIGLAISHLARINRAVDKLRPGKSAVHSAPRFRGSRPHQER